MKKISIIVPAYNEEESLPYLFERLNKLMDSNNNYEFEIFFLQIMLNNPKFVLSLLNQEEAEDKTKTY